MQKMRLLLNCSMLAVIILIGSSCIPQAPTIAPRGTTLSPTASFSNNPTSTPDIPSTPSPYPTISFGQQELLIHQLRSTSCELPCYMGIVPGETSLLEAKGILEDLGAISSGVVQYSGFVSHVFGLKLCCEAANLFHPISLMVDGDGIVQSISASVELGFGNRVPDYWSLYTLRGILEQHGHPNTLVVQVDHSGSDMIAYLVILYEEDGIAAEISLYNEGDENCFNAANMNGLKLTLTNPSSGLSLWRGGIAITDSSYWREIPEIFGITNAEFYNQIITDPSACLEVKTTSP
jgi:hypothetical protein